jgi:GTP pyrophosphokinase
MGKLKGDIEDAAFPYAYPKEYLQIEEIIKERQSLYEKYLTEVREELKTALGKNGVKFFSIDYRIKHKYSLFKKLQKYDMDIDKIFDIVALRVVVETVEECYRVLGIVHSIWNPMPGRIKDYIAVPKPNGYRSIHTTIFTGLGGVAEIQIRTREMHAEAAYGVAAHFSYKEQGRKKVKDNKDKFKWIDELKELKYSPEDPKSFIDHLKMDLFSYRIFIFTPKGDVIDLPDDSTPLDFAYAIHSDVGDHIFGSKVNGKMVPIFSKLKNGDIVEIITKKDSKPSSKWLDYVKTATAKKHIKSYLEKNTLLAKLKSFGRS